MKTLYFFLTMLIFVGTACGVSGSPPDPVPTPAISGTSTPAVINSFSETPVEDLRRRIAEFEGGENGISKGTQSPEGGLRLVHTYFGPRGRVFDLRSDIARYEIAADTLDIIRVEYVDREPPKVPFVSKGERDFDKLRKDVARITAEEARRAAIQYIRSHWEESFLQGLGERGAELVYHFGTYKFRVSWSLDATGRKIIFGVRRVSVYINPMTGEVCDVEAIRMDPPETTKIGPEEFLTIIKTEFQQLHDLEVERMVLGAVYTKEGTKRPFWSADIRYNCPKGIQIMCYGRASIRIDADTGQIVEKSAQ